MENNIFLDLQPPIVCIKHTLLSDVGSHLKGCLCYNVFCSERLQGLNLRFQHLVGLGKFIY